MANFPGETFISEGIKYVLQVGPKGNLRPYVVGPVEVAVKTRNPWIIIGAVAVVLIILGCIALSSLHDEEGSA